jgi:hypothetical protein
MEDLYYVLSGNPIDVLLSCLWAGLRWEEEASDLLRAMALMYFVICTISVLLTALISSSTTLR